MRTKEELEAGIAALRAQLSNPLLPKSARKDAQLSIAVLEWVVSDDPTKK